jgi:rRNA-processing protein FCF1
MESANKKVIALDTSALLSIAEAKADLFETAKEEFGSTVEFVIPEQVNAELEKIEKQGLKERKAVRIAKKLILNNKVKLIGVSAENADNALLELAREKKIIATNDKELIRKIKGISENNEKVLRLKKNKFFELS